MVGRVGIEPTTGRLKAECSTSELTPLSGLCSDGRNAGQDHTSPPVNIKPRDN